MFLIPSPPKTAVGFAPLPYSQRGLCRSIRMSSHDSRQPRESKCRTSTPVSSSPSASRRIRTGGPPAVRSRFRRKRSWFLERPLRLVRPGRAYGFATIPRGRPASHISGRLPSEAGERCRSSRALQNSPGGFAPAPPYTVARGPVPRWVFLCLLPFPLTATSF